MANTRYVAKSRVGARLGAVALCLLGGVMVAASQAGADDDDEPVVGTGPCSKTAQALYTACGFDVRDDLWVHKAQCLNVSDQAAREECMDEARAARYEAVEECEDQFEARVAFCEAVGEHRYDPDFDPARFVDPREIGVSVEANPYFPLVEGNKWVYEADFTDEDGEPVHEQVTVVVTDKTKLIDGVTCRVVNDLVLVNGSPLEDTNDWYAQDIEGNVWYCGEEVRDFETFEGDDPQEPELVAIDGSFKVGRDRAKGGLIMLRYPEVGEIYRQEAAFGDAEDYAEVISTEGTESVPAAGCQGDCVVTREGNLLEPDALADKYYAPGVGCILETEGGVRVELVDFSQATP